MTRWNTWVKKCGAKVLVCGLLCGSVYQNLAAQATPPPQNIGPLDRHGAMEIELAEKESRSYWIQMAASEYAAMTIDCGGKFAAAWLLDPTNERIDGEKVNVKTPKQTLELVAAEPGRYALELQNRQKKETSIRCRVELQQTRSASAQELDLQQARTSSFKAGILADAGKYEEAAKAARNALELREKVLGPSDPLLARPHYILGNIYNLQANYPKAEEYYVRALQIAEAQNNLKANEEEIFAIENNLGAIYQITGQLKKAAELLSQAVELREKSAGLEDPLLAYPLGNLANVYYNRADYEQSLRAFERVARLEEKINGPDSTGLADALHGEGNANMARGDYLSAEDHYSRALAIYEKAGSTEALNPLIGLGNLYSLQAEPEKAKASYQRALTILEKSVGTEHPKFALVLYNLAECYLTEREFTKAEDFYRRALAIREKILGESHSDVAQTLDGLGTLNRERGDYAAALEFYGRALEIDEKALGPEHPTVVSVLTHISMLHMARGNFSEAEAPLSRAIEISERNSDLNLQTGSERQKLAYLDLLSSQLNEAITLNARLGDSGPSRELAATIVLRRKGRVLDLLADSLKTVRRSLSVEDSNLIAEYMDVTAQLARLVLDGRQATPMEDYQKKIEVLKKERERLESEISERSIRFRADAQDVTISAVQAAVPADAALLEIVSYRRFLPMGNIVQDRVGEPRYAVYVLRSAGAGRWAELGEAKEIDSAVEKLREALRDPHRSDLARIAQSVDSNVMEPIRALIGDAKHLLISPDGQLSLIPFEALVDRNNHFELERYSITYVSTGRDLLRMQVQREPKSGPLLIANPLFGEPDLSPALRPSDKNSGRVVAQRRSITTADDLTSVYFAPLSGTAAEANAIRSFFPDAKLLMGAQATKAALEHVEAPSLLHIATHGFFLTDTDKQKTGLGPNNGGAIQPNAKVDNPLLRSGLALAGANLNKGGADDGVLTALEASGLNLWGTKLVTLSACDTGVGEVKNGEGVYGLRRAFFLAGTESLVMSLWPVSDYVTRELMTEYYAGLQKGLGRGEALRQAQLAMLKRKGRQHPFYWASFIQAGEWATLDGKR